MAYGGNPIGNPIDRLRVAVGDADPDYEFLDDETYKYYLQKNNNREGRATLDIIKAIMFTLARRSRERAGDVEVYGNQMFENYLSALKLMLKDHFLMDIVAFPFCGGISRQDMENNMNNIDNVDKPIFMGFQRGKPAYMDKMIWLDSPSSTNTTF